MKYYKSYKIVWFFVAMVAIPFFNACDDTNEWGVDNDYNRLFRPSNLAVTNVLANTATASWVAIPGTEKYLLELSKDSLKFENIVGTMEATTNSYNLMELEGNTQYSIRVKAMPANQTTSESKYASVYFKTKAEQILSPVADGDRTANSVTLRWTAGLAVSVIKIVNSQGELVKSVDISGEVKALGVITIDGLSPKTSYTANIFNGDNQRGSVSFMTYPEVPAADLIVYMDASDVLTQEMFDALSEYGSVTFAMPAGAAFSSATAITLPDGLSVHFFGLAGESKAKLSINQIKLNANHGYLKFTNLDVSGIGYNSDGTPTGTTFNYLINQSDGTNVGTVELQDCLLHDFNNTPFRLQATATKNIDNLILNNCVVYNIPDAYYFINTNVASGVISNIVITNSTFYNVSRFIVHSAANNNSIVVSDCTFNNILAAGRYFIDMSANFSPATFKLTNLILGATKDATARGVRASVAPIVTNTFATSDWVVSSNAIGGLSTYSGASTSLFVNPAVGDFTIKDELFEGKSSAGDPRWRIN